MSKIALVLPGNALHANHLSPAMARMDVERCGLPILRKWNMPVTAFCQGLDLLLKPWLAQEMQIRGSVEWGHAPFSHSFLPLVEGSWRDELDERKMVHGDVPVTFFSEFFPPEASQIPTEFTMLLPGSSALYDWNRSDDIDVQEFPAHVDAIRFGGKTGILIREEWFREFLNAFFRFQRHPLTGNRKSDYLAELVAAICKIGESPDDRTIVVPIDMEAPWVGSTYGALVWEMFCAEIHRQKLESVFTPLSLHLDAFASRAVASTQPHRELLKWATWDVQLRHIMRVGKYQPKNPEQAIVKMIATGSDILAAWDRKIQESRGRAIRKAGLDPFGRPIEIPISYNQSVVDITLAACRSFERGRPFQVEIEELEMPHDHLFALSYSMAQRLGL